MLVIFRSKAESVTRVLVMVPTRELGVQVFQVSKQLCQFTSVDVALSVGGLDLRLQEAALRKNPDIVIATPGRLIDHIKNTPSFGLENIEVLILDEADRYKLRKLVEVDPVFCFLFDSLISGRENLALPLKSK